MVTFHTDRRWQDSLTLYGRFNTRHLAFACPRGCDFCNLDVYNNPQRLVYLQRLLDRTAPPVRLVVGV